MQDWLTFDDPRFEVRFRYPAVAPSGRPVEMRESQPGDALRAHAFSEGREVYFELTRYPPTPGEAEYRSHKPYLDERFGAGAVTALTDTVVASRPAQTYSFAWPEGERVVYLLRTASATYRVIINSASALNQQILETLEAREQTDEQDSAE